ncbi:uncharacterized protein LOC107858745 [Capsicum annuum]|uniref:uncharacterized protein LOC107858745 n=1 Tax=Capsicum annuum TaxID=4072 RepID=UPI0007BF3029|nr:uncharacterized protein LOC107858745 [Capsicum annuum]
MRDMRNRLIIEPDGYGSHGFSFLLVHYFQHSLTSLNPLTEKELGRTITQAEAFKATYTRKKKPPEDPDVWVEPRAQLTYNRYLQCIKDFRQTLSEDKRDLPLSQEQNERI